MKLSNILSNTVFTILLIIFVYEMFTDKKCKKEGLVPEENPWPKGCPKSQNNIAIKQGRKIDNLASRFLGLEATIKDLTDKQKKIAEADKHLNIKIGRVAKRGQKQLKDAEKDTEKVSLPGKTDNKKKEEIKF